MSRSFSADTHTTCLCAQVTPFCRIRRRVSAHSANDSANDSVNCCANCRVDHRRATLSTVLPTDLLSGAMDDLQQIPWLAPRRFAAMANLPLSTVYRWVREDKIKHQRRNGRLWLSPADLDVGGRTPGVVPRRYRDEFGQLLPGAVCPREELLFGTAGEAVERSFAVARHRVELKGDGGLSGHDLAGGDDMESIVAKASEVWDDRERGVRHRLLY